MTHSQRPRRRPRRLRFATVTLAVTVPTSAVVGVFILFQPATPPSVTAIAVAPEPPPAILDRHVRTTAISDILANRAEIAAAFRLDVDPVILVIDFPDLHSQALMLNRVAALIEKADMPHDRVIPEAELNARIRATGADPDEYYYGHDYRAADLARFFRLADASRQPLNPAEMALRDMLNDQGFLRPNAVGAVISVSAPSAGVDAAARNTILRHELSHAVFFTDPGYVALTWHLWRDLLTEQERHAIVRFLSSDGYDTTNEELMANEAQAYLIHTHNERYFTPSVIGLDPTRTLLLRSVFLGALQMPWLKESALTVAPLTAEASQDSTADPH